jgi:hypothetical protein
VSIRPPCSEGTGVHQPTAEKERPIWVPNASGPFKWLHYSIPSSAGYSGARLPPFNYFLRSERKCGTSHIDGIQLVSRTRAFQKFKKKEKFKKKREKCFWFVFLTNEILVFPQKMKFFYHPASFSFYLLFWL